MNAKPLCPKECVHLKWVERHQRHGCFPRLNEGGYLVLEPAPPEKDEKPRYYRDRECPPDAARRVLEEPKPPEKIGQRRLLKVYTIVHRRDDPTGGLWLEIGVAARCNDGTIAVRLDAVPTNGTLHIKEGE